MGLSSTITAAFSLMLLIGAMTNLLTLSSQLREGLLDLSERLTGGCQDQSAELSILSINGSEVVAGLRILRGCGLRLRDLATSDLYAYYRTGGGLQGFSRLRPGLDWWVVNVTAPGGVELLNPSEPGAWEGVLDPGEEAVIMAMLPAGFEPGYGVALILVTPDGWRLVGAG